MHLLMIITAITIACWLRYSGKIPEDHWHLRWRKTLFLFLFPPLLIFMTVTAVICMGTQGKMGGFYTDSFSYLLAVIFLIIFNILGIKLAFQGWKSVQSARKCPQTHLAGKQVRLLQTQALFAGQMGFWHPELVVSQGLIENLSPDQLESVFAHEQGHYLYRDTFWFFWLGWVRSSTAWLPNTEPLWEELLMLRELRADSYAASQIDPLLLAESLLLVVSNQPLTSEVCCAALGSSGIDRLERRINALLTPNTKIPERRFQFCYLFFPAFLPLLAVIFHTA